MSTTKPNVDSEGFYYYNHKRKIWILEPHSLELPPDVIDNISILAMFPFDGVLCQSRLMAKDFIDAGIDTLKYQWPQVSVRVFVR